MNLWPKDDRETAPGPAKTKENAENHLRNSQGEKKDKREGGKEEKRRRGRAGEKKPHERDKKKGTKRSSHANPLA